MCVCLILFSFRAQCPQVFDRSLCARAQCLCMMCMIREEEEGIVGVYKRDCGFFGRARLMGGIAARYERGSGCAAVECVIAAFE